MMYNLKKNNSLVKVILILLVVLSLIGVSVYFFFIKNNDDEANDGTNGRAITNEQAETDTVDIPEEEPQTKTEVSLTAIGDIMFHDDQLESGLEIDDTFDFNPMFADVKPLLSSADITLANFETTLGGSSLGFTGYPQFNSPDEVADAIQNAGVDILTTANNHSLDTRDDGLKRTAKVLQDKGFKTVGTYEKEPDSRVLTHEVNDITFAILSYTESTNGLGDQYPADELNAMINLMTKENIERDVQEAKQLNVDFIITFMHWGEEYMRKPNERQIEYANFMAELGVDLILGSHPHVIQPTDIIKTDDKETFVVYSMGNFVSNQRVETLGEDFARTEDGVIIDFTIEKNYDSEETTITNIEYTPTWVHKIIDPNTNKPAYRILPVEQFLTSDDISDDFKVRMEQSYEATMSQVAN